MYVHRGFLTVHEPIVEGIDDAWVINLDRRADRMKSFLEVHPSLKDRVIRQSAIDGKTLQMTPAIARLFAPNDFGWKKSVMGCALSHLDIWVRLANEQDNINSYLIMEDDARLDNRWTNLWKKAQKNGEIPVDYDVIYLGGILPPNRVGFELSVEKVNNSIGRIKENNIFGQAVPDRYFHFCAYAYVLTKAGARKVIDVLKARNGYWTSADHMICNIQNILNIYFFHPLIAGCFQDDDPVYKNSSFNDFSRCDTFDSDLWNNTEKFTPPATDKSLLNITQALKDAQIIHKSRFVSVNQRFNLGEMHEYAWFQKMFPGIPLDIEVVTECESEPIVVLMQPLGKSIEVLKGWAAAGKKFYLLHLSDEHGTDPIDMYNWPECLGVIRNYIRPDLVESEKVQVIPLGYHWAAQLNGAPLEKTPIPSLRSLSWSFVGTKWMNREEKLAYLNVVPSDKKLHLTDTWRSPNMLGREETLSILLNSWCVPCPGGNNAETYRIYEALEAGAIPVFVQEKGMEDYLIYFKKHMPIIISDNWHNAAELIHTLRIQPEIYVKYRRQLLVAWEIWKTNTQQTICKVLKI